MKNQMSEKRTIEGSSRTLLLFFFCLFCYLAGADRAGWTPETAIDFVTFGKSNAKALLTAGVYQKFPCADPGSCRRGKIGNLDFPDLLGNSKPVQVCPACKVVISKHSLCVPTAAACKGNPLYLLTGGGVMPTSGHARRDRPGQPQDL